MRDKKDRSAAAIALAFYYQGCFALVTLLSQIEDRARVAVEKEDDVLLEATLKTLSQLKHKERPLSLRSDDLWCAIDNWLDHLADVTTTFQLVTTADLADDAVLGVLTGNATATQLATVREAFVIEAKRVLSRISLADRQTGSDRYRKRRRGCERFAALSDDQQLAFLSRLVVSPRSFSVGEVEDQVVALLHTTAPKVRSNVANRLIEWWDRQVALALMKKRECFLTRVEVLEQLALINTYFFSDRLPDDYADKTPPTNLDDTPNLVRQIQLTTAEDFWILRAKQERWRARAQRQRWMNDGFTFLQRLEQFDKALIDEWEYRFQIKKEDCGTDPSLEPAAGAALLRWSFVDAPNEVPPIHPSWSSSFLVRGTYQQLSNDLKVGWHPRYRALMGVEDDDPK
jgi:hypothetical protein